MEQLVNILRSPGFSAPLNITLKSENPSPSGVWFRFHHGMSWVSYGEKITITLTPLAATTILVQIHSECGMPTQIIDWGKNRSVVTNIYNQLMISLTSNPDAYSAQSAPQQAPQAASQPTYQPAPQQAPQAAPQPTYQPAPQQAPQAAPQPTYQPAPQTAQAGGFKFCFKCGSKLAKDAVFCNMCGQKQQ